jgi:predicted NUDIX family NTP pyrophosphohydrolase
MKITVVANESGDVIAAVVHPGGPMSHDSRDGARIKPSDKQSSVTVEAPDELAHRTPDSEYLEILRQQYTIREGSLTKRY